MYEIGDSVMDEHYGGVVNRVWIFRKGRYMSARFLTTTTIAQEEGGRPKKSLRQPLLADQHAINHPPRPVPFEKGNQES